MCGISAIILKYASGMPLEARIREMTGLIAHRGPDADGFFIEGKVALGHRRLSIIDLSDAGRQPMQRGALTISYNGEIYNYIELKQELETLGHHFTTRTDTEVILAAYQQWGAECLHRFNGMWGLVIFDKEKNEVFVARDRFGVKPVYYIDTPDYLAVGSEMRQLLPLLPAVKANLHMVQDFILTRMAEHTEDTFFGGVKRLMGGHHMQVSLASGTHHIAQWYHLQPQANIYHIAAEADAARDLRSLLESAVALRLRSDVRVGTCLSGGLDSSSVAMLASQMHSASAASEPFHAITAVSAEEATDESSFAHAVAEHGNMRWLQFTPSYEAFLEALPNVVRAQEEPFTTTSLIMQHLVMQTAKENGITVLLDGQGGDEILLGYDKYYPALLLKLLQAGRAREALRVWRNMVGSTGAMSIKNMLLYIAGGCFPEARYAFYLHQHRYLRDAPPVPQHIRDFSRGMRDIELLQTLEITKTNLPLLLRYEDKNSMAYGIEARLPFLDYRVAEFCLGLPWELKLKGGWGKYLLRKSVQDILPETITWRRRKLGFESPENIWLKHHQEMMLESVCASAIMASIANIDRLRHTYLALPLRTRWRIYSIALWEQAFSVAA